MFHTMAMVILNYLLEDFASFINICGFQGQKSYTQKKGASLMEDGVLRSFKIRDPIFILDLGSLRPQMALDLRSPLPT